MTTPEPRGKMLPTDWDRDDIAMDEMLALVSGGGEDMRQWLSRTRKPSPARLMYHAFEQGMHAGIVGYNHKRDCPYATNDYRMWWMHGCIVGNERRLPASPPLSDDERQELEEISGGALTMANDYAASLEKRLADANARIAALEAELSKTQAFKTWVHSFLDGKGVPADPDPDANAKHGCRISGRFKWLFSELAQARAEAAEANPKAASFDELWKVCVELGMRVHPPGEDEDGVYQPEEYAYQFGFIRGLKQRAAAAEAERIKYREAISHAAFALWGDGQQKLAAAEADFKRLMDELGIDWNGEQVAAPQAEKPT